MVTSNKDIMGGIANGTRAKVSKIVLKPDVTSKVVDCGTFKVNAVRANQLEKIMFENENDKMTNRIFDLIPEKT